MAGPLQSERYPDQEDALYRRKFEILFREHFTGLCYFARKYTGDLDSAKEIVHNVFFRIWENRSDFEWEKPAKSYLFTSVYNRSLNYIRDNRKLIRQENFQDFHWIADESAYSENLETAELENRIRQTLQRLPEKCRQIFELSRFEQKKYTEIALQLDISVKTVETQMSKALHMLRQELKDYLTVLVLMLIKNMQNW